MKRLNKEGFTLVELLSVIVIMGLIMALAFPSIRGMIDNTDRKKFNAYEKSMEEYAKVYFEDETQIIGLSSLKEVGLKGIDNSCVGYVDPTLNFKAYLKCGDQYETDDFNTSYAS